jgi:hypothetical protein
METVAIPAVEGNRRVVSWPAGEKKSRWPEKPFLNRSPLTVLSGQHRHRKHLDFCLHLPIRFSGIQPCIGIGMESASTWRHCVPLSVVSIQQEP